jgi:hypothetical protein
MSNTKDFISEDIMPCDQAKMGAVDIRDEEVRDNINSLLMRVTTRKFLTPYIALERVSKILASFHVHVPRQNFLEGDTGAIVIPANQFGEKYGMKDDGSVVTATDLPYNIFFEWEASDCGMYDIFCQIIDEKELDEILEDMEEEASEEEDNELNEDNKTLSEVSLKTASAAYKESKRRKNLADKNPHPTETTKRFSGLYDTYAKIAKRAMERKQKKPSEQSVVSESNQENKIKKKFAILKIGGEEGEKPKVNSTTAIKKARAKLGPKVNEFDIRNLKVAEEKINENLGKAMKKFKFWYKGTGPDGTGDPRDVKKNLKNDPELTKSVASREGKLGGAAELQRRLAKKMVKKNTDSK